LVANVLSELDEIMRRTVRVCNGDIRVLNDKALKTISMHSETCLRVFGTIDCEVDNQLKAKYSYSGKPRIQKAAEDIFLEQRMDKLRLELKEAKEALMLVLQVALLARSRIVSKALVYLLPTLPKPSSARTAAVLSVTPSAKRFIETPRVWPERSLTLSKEQPTFGGPIKVVLERRPRVSLDPNTQG